MTEFDHNIPVFIQIIEMLKQQISSSQLKAGDKMLSVRDLAAQMRVNPNTVQRAYRELEVEALIESRRGLGSYVTEDQEKLEGVRNDMAKCMSQDFVSKMYKMGFELNEILAYIQKSQEEKRP